MNRAGRFVMTSMLGLAFCAGVGLAAGPGVAGRQLNQQKRISQGVRSGELTKRETLRLERNAGRINRSVRRDRIDQGVFTPRERATAQKRLNRQSRAIYRQKNDGQRR